MGVYRELLRGKVVRLRRGGIGTFGAAVVAAGLAIAVGAPTALADQPRITNKGQAVKSPVSRRMPGDGIDFANAIAMPLPQGIIGPASPSEAMLRVPDRGSAPPRTHPGAPGNNALRPIVLVPAKPPAEKSTSGAAVPEEFGTGGVPYTTSQVNALLDDTDLHYPFSAAGKLFFNIGTQTIVCSASLVARGLVVTAAHCVANFGQNQFYTNWQFVPAYNNGVAPYGVATAKTATVLPSYLDGTDPCAQAGVICQDDVAIITLNPIDSAGTYIGALTGWLGFAADGYGYTGGLTQVAQLGYPVALDSGSLMERTDSQGYIDGNLVNNTIIGSLMTGGSSGGPWVLNLGLQPSLAGTAFGQAAVHNLVTGVTSWGFESPDDRQGASLFTSGNIVTLFGVTCGGTPAACQ